MNAREALADMQVIANECLHDAASSNDLQAWVDSIEAELPSEATLRFLEAAIEVGSARLAMFPPPEEDSK